MNVGQRIQARRKELGLSADDIAIALNKNRSTIYRYESSDIEKLPTTVLEPLAKILRTTPAYLMGWEDHKSGEIAPAPESAQLPPGATPYNPTIHQIPILGTIAAGLPLYAEQNIEGYTYTDLNGGAEYFALLVKGDSMNAIGINEGNLLIVRRQPEVENGELAVVMVNEDNATVKYFYHTDDTVELIPRSFNPSHQVQRYNLKNNSIRIIGKVVECKIKFT